MEPILATGKGEFLCCPTLRIPPILHLIKIIAGTLSNIKARRRMHVVTETVSNPIHKGALSKSELTHFNGFSFGTRLVNSL